VQPAFWRGGFDPREIVGSTLPLFGSAAFTFGNTARYLGYLEGRAVLRIDWRDQSIQ